MAEGKKSFILYVDQKEIWDTLADEQAGKLIKHIFKYVNDEDPILEDALLNMAFLPIKQSLKRDLKKWESQYTQRVEAGKKSAEVRKRNATLVNGRSISSTDNVSVSVSVSDSVSKKKKYIPPSLEDVKKYFSEKGYRKDVAEHAFNYYEANEWKDSKGNQVKAWKQKMIGVWFKPENLDNKPSKTHTGEQIYKCTFTNDGEYVRMFTEEKIKNWTKVNPECKLKTKVKA